MKNIFFVFPHQLFKDISILKNADEIYLIEEWLFFKQYSFHKQKLVLHRASMKYYENYLRENNIKVQYIESTSDFNDIRNLISHMSQQKDLTLEYYDVCDDWLEQRINKSCNNHKVKIKKHDTPAFLNTSEELKKYFEGKKRFLQNDFYIQQRKKLNILIDKDQKPIGDKWSFDADNRLKYPKEKQAPAVEFPKSNVYYKEAVDYVEKHFTNNNGIISDNFIYPITHTDSESWMEQFFEKRFEEFGKYEDAIVKEEVLLNHSLLSPLMNNGLLTPSQVLNAVMKFAEANNISISSLEGFIRQVIGWREFIRGVYLYKGKLERTRNFLNFSKKIPASFYNAETGIEPIDCAIKNVTATGYCHHIERLMILGNFMLLCEFHPDEVYKWFMEMFIDAYDWVMVPNVYGMSQYADGGLMATKPYISGSSYVLKMSNYKKGNWADVWDALFWNFMNKQRNVIASNPRMAMLLKTYDKMSEAKKNNMELLVKSLVLN